MKVERGEKGVNKNREDEKKKCIKKKQETVITKKRGKIFVQQEKLKYEENEQLGLCVWAAARMIRDIH